MVRSKGKGRKEAKQPFVASIKCRHISDKDFDVNVSVTLDTTIREMKRRIAAAEPRLRADRMTLISMGNRLDDGDKTLADWEDVTRNSLFVLLSTVCLTVQTVEGHTFMFEEPTNQAIKHIKNSIDRYSTPGTYSSPESLEAGHLPVVSMVLVHDGAVLRNDDKFVEKGITEGSVVMCLVRRPPESAPCDARRWWKMARRLCDVCGRQGRISKPTFPRCDACGILRYCGEECQRADWEARHSRLCPGPLLDPESDFYEADKRWLPPKHHVDAVMRQTSCSRGKAARAILANDGDLVNEIRELTM